MTKVFQGDRPGEVVLSDHSALSRWVTEQMGVPVNREVPRTERVTLRVSKQDFEYLDELAALFGETRTAVAEKVMQNALQDVREAVESGPVGGGVTMVLDDDGGLYHLSEQEEAA